MTQRLKKASIIISITVGALILGAVIFGILNALIGNGNWNFGWNNYRYDETGYEMGDGTIPSEKITGIAIDWIDGEVEIVPCQDLFVSVTESSEQKLPDSAKLRWKVEADGTLQIKYRKSAWFFGFGSNDRNKKLIIRIPEHFFDQLTELDVTAVSSDVSIKGISCTKLDVETVSGNVSLTGCAFGELDLETVSGDMTLQMSETAKKADLDSTSGNIGITFSKQTAFRLTWESVSGRVDAPAQITADQNVYAYGDAPASDRTEIEIETVSGDLALNFYE